MSPSVASEVAAFSRVLCQHHCFNGWVDGSFGTNMGKCSVVMNLHMSAFAAACFNRLHIIFAIANVIDELLEALKLASNSFLNGAGL